MSSSSGNTCVWSGASSLDALIHMPRPPSVSPTSSYSTRAFLPWVQAAAFAADTTASLAPPSTKIVSGIWCPQYSAACKESSRRCSEASRRQAKTKIVMLSRRALGANSARAQTDSTTGTGCSCFC